MPPSTANDQWLSGRHFGVVIDAGSSGSRVQIYSWKDPKVVTLDKSIDLGTLPTVEKGTQDGEGWVSKVEPGISSFADNPENLTGYLRPLLAHAQDHIPPSLHADTPLFLLATAGMRLIPPEKQAEILLQTCSFFVHHSNFKLDVAGETGPCGSSIRIITGEEEGLFGWIAVNYLMDGFTGANNQTTYGFLDMGGASTQIAFEPNKAHHADAESLVDVSLRLLDGQEISHKVFVTTWLGYGTNQARERYVGHAINHYEDNRSLGTAETDAVPDPCLPKDLALTETPVQPGDVSDHSRKAHHLLGTGSFEQCVEKTSVLLNNNTPCPDTPCLMNGVHVPPIDFSVSHFIGVSEYWYSSDHVFGLGGAYDYVQYERAASTFCSRDWDDIVKEHEQSKGRNTGDGEVHEDGTVLKVGRWGENVEIPRLQMQCFKAAWIANVLHEGIGMPRLVDPGGNSSTHGDDIVKKAGKKGLGRPTFQSVDTVGDIAISWTLGKMVLEASKEVPITDAGKPLGDPLDNIPGADFPIQPIRPPWMDVIEDRLTPHLPPSLTRSSLGFSPVLLLFWLVVLLIAILLTYPLRRRVRSNCLRSLRTMTKQREVDIYSMEEGKNGSPYTLPSPTSTVKSFNWLKHLRRILSTSQPHRPNLSRLSTSLSIPSSPTTPTRRSPSRSYSMPPGVSLSSSRSPSPLPSPGFAPSDGFYGLSSRSNASQSSLAGLAPRSAAVSRINSMHYLSDAYETYQDE